MADIIPGPKEGTVVAILNDFGEPLETYNTNQQGDASRLPFRVAINLGEADGITYNMKFLVYLLGDEIKDPSTKKSLGNLEVLRGYGSVTHVMKNMAILRSTDHASLVPIGLPAAILGTQALPRLVEIPFRTPKVGDMVRLIKVT